MFRQSCSLLTAGPSFLSLAFLRLSRPLPILSRCFWYRSYMLITITNNQFTKRMSHPWLLTICTPGVVLRSTLESTSIPWVTKAAVRAMACRAKSFCARINHSKPGIEGGLLLHTAAMRFVNLLGCSMHGNCAFFLGMRHAQLRSVEGGATGDCGHAVPVYTSNTRFWRHLVLPVKSIHKL